MRFWFESRKGNSHKPQLRVTLRRLLRAPLFSLTIVTILGLSIASATLLFSAFYAIKLRPLPFRDPTALVPVRQTSRLDPLTALRSGDE